jgi:hypothetical protein
MYKAMIARVKHLLIEERTLSLTGEVAEVYIFDWETHGSNWALDNKAVREALKREVPAADREWNPTEKRWFVKVSYHDALCRLFDRFADDVKALEKQPTLFAAAENEA